jgi:hypothetical protein
MFGHRHRPFPKLQQRKTLVFVKNPVVLQIDDF